MPRTPDATPAANSATMRAFVHLDARGGALCARVPRQDVRHRVRRRSRRRRGVPGRHPRSQPAAQPGHPAGRRAWLPPAGRGDPRAAGHREPLRARRARHRSRRDGLRARGRGPGARAHRGAAVAGACQFADGRRAQSRVERQLPHRQADGHRRRRGHAADRRSAPHRHRGDPAAAGRRRHRADLADRLFAHRRDLQPDRRGSRDAGRRAAGGDQAHLPDGRRRRAQRPAAIAHRPFDDRRRGAARQGQQADAPTCGSTCPRPSARATTASSARTSSAAITTARCCSNCSRAMAWAR